MPRVAVIYHSGYGRARVANLARQLLAGKRALQPQTLPLGTALQAG